MTNDETMLREVDQALAEDKTSEQVRKNLPAIIAAGLIVVVGVGGWQVWSAGKTAKATANSAAYSSASEAGGDEEIHAALEKLGGESGGYAVLAKLRLAGEAASHGEREKALGLYREVYGAGAGSKRIKDVARLRAGYLALADGRDAVLKDVGDLETDETAVGFHAREIIALAALGDNRLDSQSLHRCFILSYLVDINLARFSSFYSRYPSARTSLSDHLISKVRWIRQASCNNIARCNHHTLDQDRVFLVQAVHLKGFQNIDELIA